MSDRVERSSPDTQLEDVLRRLASAPTDNDAWIRLYQLMWPFVFAITYRALGDARDLAEDASQEVFFRLARYGAEWRITDATGFKRYVGTIARNVCRTQLNQVLGSVKWIEVPSNLKVEADQEGKAVVSEMRRLFASELDEDGLKLLDLIAEESSLSRIAGVMNLSQGATAVRIHRLRKKLGPLKMAGRL
jgi:RNA polymerase sigma factor (sigma-70 family)